MCLRNKVTVQQYFKVLNLFDGLTNSLIEKNQSSKTQYKTGLRVILIAFKS